MSLDKLNVSINRNRSFSQASSVDTDVSGFSLLRYTEQENSIRAFEYVKSQRRTPRQFFPWIAIYLAQDWEDHEQPDIKVDWADAFFDLMFVAAAALFSKRISDSGDEHLLIYVGSFYTIFYHWQDTTFLRARFRTIGRKAKFLFERFFGFFFMMSLAGQIYHGPRVEDDNHYVSFLWFDLGAQICLTILTGIVHFVPRARKSNYIYIVDRSLSLVITSLFLFFFKRSRSHLLLYFTIRIAVRNLYLTIVPGCIFHRNEFPPRNAAYMIERFGLLVLFLLGEVLANIVLSFGELPIVFLFTSFLQIGTIQMLYFEFQPKVIHRHSLITKRRRGVVWLWAHNVLMCALILYSSATHLWLEKIINDEDMRQFDLWLMNGSLVGITIPMQAIWMLEHFGGFQRNVDCYQVCMMVLSSWLQFAFIIVPLLEPKAQRLGKFETAHIVNTVVFVCLLMLYLFAPSKDKPEVLSESGSGGTPRVWQATPGT